MACTMNHAHAGSDPRRASGGDVAQPGNQLVLRRRRWWDVAGWLPVGKSPSRLSEWRVHEALAVQADILAVACPYETPRFEDAAKTVPGAGN